MGLHRWGVARVVKHGAGAPPASGEAESWGRTYPVCPGERHAPYARTRNPRLPMREPPRGLGEGKPSVRLS
ncbi:hypothetical protein GCM10010260_19390 [Streptomyces filipinensis]|uniref:Uncharacterized protein n=1 Tax=Streptomyces filipinensis TaxID=66887 RepID=A0A918I869_9ACTN|nr:hypothetical protein GCM10010260_19390 [Streptomyces filipinensis]